MSGNSHRYKDVERKSSQVNDDKGYGEFFKRMKVACVYQDNERENHQEREYHEIDEAVEISKQWSCKTLEMAHDVTLYHQKISCIICIHPDTQCIDNG